ncbi:MAG: hypothetical protein UX97_C0001G0099 [Candidatus Beckwithbacteria bacterium GW2011_GWA2_47_25]|nr:MAG: hypothetical protein UX97_C0001G0099 [Candidatus Beckwithbacteria bacterium GW2011_GWA2_47_25]
MPKALKVLLVVVLIKSLAWMGLTPIFQVPDEPSHFSIVQFIAEKGRRPHPRRELVTSQEALTVSSLVNFNWKIVHPVWLGYQSNWIKAIKNIPQSDRSVFLPNSQQKSLKRPPLYYFLATPFYLSVKSQSFLWRFFLVRFFSVLAGLATVYLAYQTAQLVFRRLDLAMAAAALVAFQPTLSFIGVGVHYDPLAVLVTTAFIFLSLNFLKTRKRPWFRWSLATGFLAVLIKPDLIVLPFTLVFLVKKNRLKLILPAIFVLVAILSLLPAALTSLITSNNFLSNQLLYLTNLNEYAYHAQFFLESLFTGKIFFQFKDYLAATAPGHLAQVFPWYWGVFGWLEALGLVVLSHLAVVVLNDFKIFAASGEIYGIQGRYLLPVVAGQMIFLVLGLSQLVAKKHYPVLSRLIIAAAIGLNLIGLATVYQYFGWVWS